MFINGTRVGLVETVVIRVSREKLTLKHTEQSPSVEGFP